MRLLPDEASAGGGVVGEVGGVVALEGGGFRLVVGGGDFYFDAFVGFPRAGALFFHVVLEGGFIHVESAFAGHELGEVQGEAVGVVEFEGEFAGEFVRFVGFLVLFELFGFASEEFDASVEGFAEGFFFGAYGFLDEFLALGEFGEGGAHLLTSTGTSLWKKGRVKPRLWP